MSTQRNLKLLSLSTPIDRSLSLPVVHNQLLGFANVEMEVVVLAPDVRALAFSL